MNRRLISTERMMLALVNVKKDDDVPRHAQENEPITYILNGALRFGLGVDVERELMVRTGEVRVIPCNRRRRALALDDTLGVDVFNPPRQVWLHGTDAYLRR